MIEREWLEERLAAVAARVEESLTEMRPDAAIADIGRRFEQLEHRLDSAFDGVARQADVEGLKLVEAHITELTSQVETLRSELARFSGLEAQIGELRSQLSDDQIVRLFGSLVPTEQDLVRFADAAHRAAEQVRCTAAARAAGGAGRACALAGRRRAHVPAARAAQRLRRRAAPRGGAHERSARHDAAGDAADPGSRRRHGDAPSELPQLPAQHFDREPPRFAADPAPYQPAQHMAADAGSASRNFADEAKAAAKAGESRRERARAPAGPRAHRAPPQGRAMRVEPELSVPVAIAAAAPQSAPPSPGDRRAFMDIARRAAERAKAVDPEPEAGPAPRTDARKASKPAADPGRLAEPQGPPVRRQG